MSELPLRLFLDRGTQGRRFVAAVREMVADVEAIDDRYGRDEAQRVPDVRWIAADATASGRVLVGADRYLPRNPLERRAVCRASARYLVFGTNNLRIDGMVELFAQYLPRIRQLPAEPGPWVYRNSQHDLARLPLRCDDV